MEMELERRILYYCYNHGVVAVVNKETMQKLDFRHSLRRSLRSEHLPELLACVSSQIYTFSDSSERSPFFCGPIRMLEQMVKDSRVTLRRANFYVPFSQSEITEEDLQLEGFPFTLLGDLGLLNP